MTKGRLLVYDVGNFVKWENRSSKMNVIWDSQLPNYAFPVPEFTVGAVSGGKFVTRRYDGATEVLGLA